MPLARLDLVRLAHDIQGSRGPPASYDASLPEHQDGYLTIRITSAAIAAHQT